MFKSGDFICFINSFGQEEAFRISTINGIYYDDDSNGYIILYNDGSEIILDMLKSDVELFIGLLV